MIFLHAGNIGADNVVRKVKATIAKDLGLPGKVSALTTDLDASVLPGYKDSPEKIRQAILVAWSELK
jgi:hypothetical protein